MGIFLDFIRLTVRTPHGAYVRRANRNRIDRHWGEIERLPLQVWSAVLSQGSLADVKEIATLPTNETFVDLVGNIKPLVIVQPAVKTCAASRYEDATHTFACADAAEVLAVSCEYGDETLLIMCADTCAATTTATTTTTTTTTATLGANRTNQSTASPGTTPMGTTATTLPPTVHNLTHHREDNRTFTAHRDDGATVTKHANGTLVVKHADGTTYAWARSGDVMVRVMGRSISPRWEATQFRLATHAYAPWGPSVRGVSLTKSGQITTRNMLPLFSVLR